MELKTSEVGGGIAWLLGAGAAAIGLSIFLFWADDSVMGNAKVRDLAHNEQMKELRTAQSALPARVTDERQLLPLTIEGEDSSSTDSKGH